MSIGNEITSVHTNVYFVLQQRLQIQNIYLDDSVTNKEQVQVKRQVQCKKTFSHGGK